MGESGREGERKEKKVFQHQTTVSETRGNILTLLCAFFDDAL